MTETVQKTPDCYTYTAVLTANSRQKTWKGGDLILNNLYHLIDAVSHVLADKNFLSLLIRKTTSLQYGCRILNIKSDLQNTCAVQSNLNWSGTLVIFPSSCFIIFTLSVQPIDGFLLRCIHTHFALHHLHVRKFYSGLIFCCFAYLPLSHSLLRIIKQPRNNVEYYLICVNVSWYKTASLYILRLKHFSLIKYCHQRFWFEGKVILNV